MLSAFADALVAFVQFVEDIDMKRGRNYNCTAVIPLHSSEAREYKKVGCFSPARMLCSIEQSVSKSHPLLVSQYVTELALSLGHWQAVHNHIEEGCSLEMETSISSSVF